MSVKNAKGHSVPRELTRKDHNHYYILLPRDWELKELAIQNMLTLTTENGKGV